VKRVLGLVLLAIVALGGVYGYALTRQQARYLALIERGDTALARDDTFAAIEAFTTAIAIKPDSMAAHLKRGEAHRRRKEFESALRDLRRAAALDPLAPYPREILGDVSAAMGRHARAADHYLEYLALDDRAPRVLYKLALARLENGQTASASGYLRQAIALDDRFTEAYYLLGVCLNALHRPTEAIAMLDRAIALNQGFQQAHEELAALYGRLNRHDQQNRQLELLAALDQRGSREVSLALGYARDGQVERAVQRLRNAARHFPDEEHTYAAVGRLWLERAERGDRVELNKALEALSTATANEPTSEALTLYARALVLNGELGRAQSVLMQAIGLFPVDPLAFYYLADVAERRGQATVAEQALLDYVRLEGIESPRLSGHDLARIAAAQLKTGNLAGARLATERALKKDPSNALALLLRAQIH
jgi:tetratricopeptide (TPR) repeat protein